MCRQSGASAFAALTPLQSACSSGMSAPDIRSRVHQAVTGVWGNVKQRHQDLERRVSVNYPLTRRTVLLPSAFRKRRCSGRSTRPEAGTLRCATLRRSARPTWSCSVSAGGVSPRDSRPRSNRTIHARAWSQESTEDSASALASRRRRRSVPPMSTGGLTGAQASHRTRCRHHACTRCWRSVPDVERLARRQRSVYHGGARP